MARLIRSFELGYRYEQEQNKIKLNGNVHWKDSQRLMAELDGSTEEHDNVKEWRANCGISSSIHDILSTTVNVTHKVIGWETANTRLLVKYHPDKVINAWSIWHLDKKSDDVFNLTGNLHLESPVTRYKVSDMKCQLQVLPNWKFLGAANLDLDVKTYTGKLIGDLHRLKESMVEFNVTTPLEKFSLVRGRFGLSESNRHIVAEVTTPASVIGFEILCQFITPIYNFNVLLSLATPLEILQRLLLVAKLNNREADFRVGYNRILAGFQGIWHYRNITDFHYSYVLFTPVEGFEENGIVAKLIVARDKNESVDIDTEFSIRMSDKKYADVKIGVRAKAGPKPAPITIPIIITGNQTNIDEVKNDGSKELTENEDNVEKDELDQFEDYEEQSSLHWHGEFEVCVIIIEPIVGELDIDNEGPTYKVAAVLGSFDDKKILLHDTFWMEDLFNMRNKLNLVVPFGFVNEIVCSNAFIVDLEKLIYRMEATVEVKKNVTWYETGVLAIYTYRSESEEQVLELNMKTPIESLKFININSSLRVSGSLYRPKFSVRAPDSAIDVNGFLETKESLMDTLIVIKVDTPLLKIPKSTITAKREFTVEKRYAQISCNVAEPSGLSFLSSWHATKDEIKAFVLFNSWIESLKNIKVHVSYHPNTTANNGTANLEVLAKLLDRQYKLLGNYSGDRIQSEFYTPASNGKPHLQFHGNTMKESDSIHKLNGQLLNHMTSKVSTVFGTIELTQNGSLHTVEVTIQPKEAEIGQNDSLLLKLKKEKYGLNAALIGHPINGSLDANFVNPLNWDVRARANFDKISTVEGQVQFITFMNVQVNGNTTLYVHAETPLPDIRNVTLTGSMLMSNNSGDIRASGWLNEYTRYTILQWKLIYMADMFGRVLIGYEGPTDLDNRLVDTRLFFKNPRQAFKNVDVGFDLDVDREKWKFAANATVGFRNHENIDGVFTVRLPPPDNDDHRLLISYHANGGFKDVSYVIGYNCLRAKTNYASDGSVCLFTFFYLVSLNI